MAPSMRAAYAMDPARFTTAAVQTSLQGTAIATATSSMPSGCVAAVALLISTATACVTTWTPALARTMCVACATDPARFTIAGVQTSPLVIATAMATSSMRRAFVVEAAQLMQTATVCATTWTPVWVRTIRAGCATALEPSSNAAAPTSLQGIATATATSSMPLVFVAAAVRLTQTAMAFVTTWTLALARLTRAGCAMAPARFTPVAAPTSLQGIATATATSSMRSGCVAAAARLMRMRMASVTT